jgi:hypothetical protein
VAQSQDRWARVADGANRSARLALTQDDAVAVEGWVARLVAAAEALGATPGGADPTDE